MKDIIRLSGMSFYGYHGVTAAEKETGRMFEVDCELEVDLADAGSTDKLTDTIDYSLVYEEIRQTLQDRAFSLLESIATHLATKLLDKFPLYRVTLKVRKRTPPIAGHIKFIEVEITRYQTEPERLIDQNDNSKND